MLVQIWEQPPFSVLHSLISEIGVKHYCTGFEFSYFYFCLSYQHLAETRGPKIDDLYYRPKWWTNTYKIGIFFLIFFKHYLMNIQAQYCNI